MAVDHVLPFVLMSRGWQDGDLHQVWNLVLACYACNSAKRDLPPAQGLDALAGTARRGPDHLTPSLSRDTLISQLGPDRASRNQTLVRRHTAAVEMMRSSWMPPVSTVGC